MLLYNYFQLSPAVIKRPVLYLFWVKLWVWKPREELKMVKVPDIAGFPLERLLFSTYPAPDACWGGPWALGFLGIISINLDKSLARWGLLSHPF